MFTVLSKFNFTRLLRERSVENIDLISTIEKFLYKSRGFVVQKPKQKEPVILLLSGGLDSIVAWEVLMSWYDSVVYPVFISRGKNQRVRKEWSSVYYFASYFQRKYPDNYRSPFRMRVNTLPKDYESYFTTIALSAEEILANFDSQRSYIKDGSNVLIKRVNNIDPYLTAFYGVMYAQYLENKFQIKIRNLFVGVNASDGKEGSSQSFTALRSTLLSMCAATANYDWSFSSVFFEKELGLALDKTDVVALGAELGLPMERTWTCFNHGLWQCGDACATCEDRRNAFVLAGVKDKTFYLSSFKALPDLLVREAKNLVKSIIYKF